MNAKTRDIAARALKTFWQAALAYLLADAAVLQQALSDPAGERGVLLSLLVGALAAGLSALYNALVRPLLENGHGE